MVAVLLALTYLLQGGVLLTGTRVVLSIVILLSIVLFGYLYHARNLLPYDGGGIQGKILDNVLGTSTGTARGLCSTSAAAAASWR